jgi:hypothetical protein
MATSKMNIGFDKKAREVVVRIPYPEDVDPKTFEKSASGKSYIIGHTRGYTEIPETPDDKLQISVSLIWSIPKADRSAA